MSSAQFLRHYRLGITATQRLQATFPGRAGSGHLSAAELNRRVITWLDRRTPGPFFVFINYFDGHPPYQTPAIFDTAFGVTQPRRPNVSFRDPLPDQAELERQINAYDGAIAYLDAQVGALLDSLEQRGLRDSTLIVVTADHGDILGEHGLVGHVANLYLPVLRVPLVVALPGRVPPGRLIAGPASLRDLPVTIIDLLALDPVRAPGQSLTRRWDPAGPPAGEESEWAFSEVEAIPGLPAWAPASRGAMRSVVTSRWQYIRGGDGVEELYDLRQDPWGDVDLAGTPGVVQTLDLLRRVADSTASAGVTATASGGASPR